MKHSIRRSITSLALIGALSVAATAQAGPVQSAGAGAAGVWEIHITPDGAPGPVATNRAHFDQDGSLTNIDGMFGTGLGTWERSGARGYVSEITHYFGPDGMVVVEGFGQLGEDNHTSYGEFVTTIYIGGAMVQQFSGTIEGIRQ